MKVPIQVRRSFLVFLLVAKVAYSQASDDVAEIEALQKTQQMMLDPALRKSLVESDPKASDLDKKIMTMTKGSEALNQEVYAISADAFAELFKQSEGDAAKMEALIESAKSDPKAFYESLTPEQKIRIRSLAGKIDMNDVGKAKK